MKNLLNRSLKNAHFSITCKLWSTLQDASTSYDLFCNFPYCLPDIAHNFGIESNDNLLIGIFLYSRHLSTWDCIYIVRRNSVLITTGSERVKKACSWNLIEGCLSIFMFCFVFFSCYQMAFLLFDTCRLSFSVFKLSWTEDTFDVKVTFNKLADYFEN